MKRIGLVLLSCLLLLCGCDNKLVKPTKNIELMNINLITEEKKALIVDVKQELKEEYYVQYNIEVALNEDYDILEEDIITTVFVKKEEAVVSDKMEANSKFNKDSIILDTSVYYEEEDMLVDYDTKIEFTIIKENNQFKVDIMEIIEKEE